MEESKIVLALQAGLNPDNQVRNDAENYLKSLHYVQGFTPLLCQIAASQHPYEAKLMAATIIKNLTRATEQNQTIMQDLPQIRSFAVFFLQLDQDPKIRAQFEEITYQLIKKQGVWDGLFDTVGNALQSQSDSEKYAGLQLIYQVARAFEFKIENQRQPIDQIMARFQGDLLQMLSALIGNYTEQSLMYILIIEKIYWTATYMDIPPTMINDQVLNGWLVCFMHIIDMPMGDLENIEYYNEMDTQIVDNSIPWQCKKVAAQTVHRLFHKYWDIEGIRPANVQVGRYFLENWANPFLHNFAKHLFSRRNTYVPDQVLSYYIKFISNSFKVKQTQQSAQQYAQTIINEILILVLKKVPGDEELWNENPIEFIRKESDITLSYLSPKSAAVDLMCNMCKAGQFENIMNYVQSNIGNANPLEKEALAFMMGCLSDEIYSSSIKDNIPGFLETHIMSDFESPIGFLRKRACWMYGALCAKQFGTQAQQVQISTKICQLLKDKELPVRFEAAVTIPKILGWESAKSIIQLEIASLLQFYLELVTQIDSEDLVDSLESIVERFDDQIIPFALELCQFLTNQFFKMVHKEKSENDDSTMTAVSLINAINKIVDACQKQGELLRQLFIQVDQVIDYILSPQGSEFFEEGVSLLTCFIYYSPNNSLEGVVKYVRHLFLSILGDNATKPYGLDNLEDVFSPIANLYSKYNDAMIEHTNEILQQCYKLLDKDHQEYTLCCKILIAIIENSLGKIDGLLPNIITTIGNCMQQQESKSLKVISCQVICVAINYNTLLTLQILEQTNVREFFFQTMFQLLDKFEMNFATSHAIYAILSLLQIAEQLPAPLNTNLPQIGKNLLALIYKIYDKSDKKLKQQTQITSEEFNSEQQSPFVDSDDFNRDFNDMLQKVRHGMEAGEESSDDDFSWIDDADDLYDSPYESMQEIKSFQEVMDALQVRNVEIFNSVISLYTEQEKADLARWAAETN